MYQIESVFIGESQQGEEALIKTEVQTEIINCFRVGDVTRMAPNQFTLNCSQCSKSFYHFPEFTLHIEEHFLLGDVFISSTATVDDSFINNVLKSKRIVNEDVVKIDYTDENEPMEIVGDDIEYDNSFIEIEKNDTETMVEYRANDNDDHIPSDTVEEFESVFDLPQFIEGVTYKKVDNGFECMICGFKSAMKNNLKSHISVHIKSKKFHCSICIKGFSSIHYVQKHIKSIHKQTISADDIRKAQNTLKQIVKPKKSDRNGNAPDEVSKLKLNVLSSNYWRTEGKNFHCPFCVQWFCKPKYVQKHIRLVHGRNCKLDDILAAQIQPELKPEPTKSVEMVTQKQIESLQREQSKDTGKRAKSFECFVCHTMFVSEKALRYHMPLHSGIQYRCPLCEKYFSMQKYVRDHMIYKHGFDKKSKLPPLRKRKNRKF
ncbi:PR domain zinc finger protein 5-like [Contarinia nasturtii]|uniref:PR domain zinc finger protein 5-like n=1 Tax=Contarinia nasturtii TaxID=265458 RepID=UPI0012D38C98|nr:PR domain zinc finger protein 5-like [Contarinia nasturtii]